MSDLLTRLVPEAARLGLTTRECSSPEKFIAAAVKELAAVVVPSNEKALKRRPARVSHALGVRFEETLDSYYVRFINDALKEIRHGKNAYLFKLEHIKEVLRFEPTAKFSYNRSGDCIVARLSKPVKYPYKCRSKIPVAIEA